MLGTADGIQEQALAVEVRVAKETVLSTPFTAPATSSHIASAYVNGVPGKEVSLALLLAETKEVLAERTVPLTSDWQRIAVTYSTTQGTTWAKPKGQTPALQLRIRFSEPGRYLIDSLMLENNAGYAKRNGPSTWMEAQQIRPGERLHIGQPADQHAGTVAFWSRSIGKMGWRCLLYFGDGHGWYPQLMLSIRNDKTVKLDVSPGRGKGKGASVSCELPNPDAWHHYAVTWRGSSVSLYVDGQPAGTIAKAPRVETFGTMHVGCVATNFSPALRADSVFDEVAHWDRPLTAAETKELFDRPAPLQAGIAAQVTVRNLEPVAVVARDDRLRQWHIKVANRSDRKLPATQFRFGIDDLFSETGTLPAVPLLRSAILSLTWSPALLLPGSYTFHITVGEHRYAWPIRIVPARTPRNNVQIIDWQGLSETHRDIGMTTAGLLGTPAGPKAKQVAKANEFGLYTQLRQHVWGTPKDNSERFQRVTGSIGAADFSKGQARANAEEQAKHVMQSVAHFPDVRYMIVNTEHQTLWQPDFRPASIAAAKKNFGLDLSRWTRLPQDAVGAAVHPMGRLSAKAGKIKLPKNAVIDRDFPFYAYHRWWHGPTSGTEVTMNEIVCAASRRHAPWVQTIIEPILRRPSVRSYSKHHISEEWYYYGDPEAGISCQENLTAMTRGTNARITAMPQWLLKPGWAAPYKGLPTPDMYRETLWHCLARPMQDICYWNLRGALHKGKQQTQAEIDAKLGVKPTWTEAKSKIQVKGEKSSVALWIPELKDEIKQMHNNVVHPLGALIPKWQNRPRRIAVWRSFAGQLFNEIRWGGRSPFRRIVRDHPQPYDVLYDQDFEDNPKCLDGYDVLVIPECPPLYKPAKTPLEAMLKRGGKVFVDQYWKADLPGVIKLDWGTGKNGVDLAKLEQDLLKKYGSPSHPQYIEGVEAALRQQKQAGGPVARLAAALDQARADIQVLTRNVQINTLQAEGANYLVAVNDLRQPGPHYGHFGRVLEKGVSQTTSFAIDKELGAVAYQLLAARRLPLVEKDGRYHVRTQLGAGDGMAMIFLPARIQRMELAVEERNNRSLRITGALLDHRGKPVPGVIPMQVSITRPDGTHSSFSHYSAFVRGKWSFDFPIAYNAPKGRFTITVKELAAGIERSIPYELR